MSVTLPSLRIFLTFLACVGFHSLSVLAQTTSTWTAGAGNWAPCPSQGGTALWDTCGGAHPFYPNGNADAVIQGGPVTLGTGNGISIVNLSVASGHTVIITPGYLDITGTSISNNGTISIGVSNGLGLQGSPTVTLSGSGSVMLAHPNAHFYGANGTPTLINQQTVQGQGSFSLGMNLINQGLINANAGALSMQPTKATNTGTMEASTGSTLAFTNGLAVSYNNAGGVIRALDGGTVQLYNGVYTGGTLTTTGKGVIQAFNSAVLNGLLNSGTLQINYAALKNTITNAGTIQVPSATLFMSGNVTLTGAGSVHMSGSSSLRQLGSTDTLTNLQLIHGSGTIFQLPLTNKGIIAADSPANTLSLSGGTTTNTSTMEATGGGILQIQNTVNNPGGIIKALSGSTVDVSGTVKGGVLTTSGTGSIQSENATLDGTVNVPTNAGKLVVNNFDLFFQGKINNTGTIMLTGSSCVILNQPSILIGSGTLTMAPTTCIFGSGNSFNNQSNIRGSGTIGDSNPMPIINNGTILANQVSPLSIVPDATGFTNNGILLVNNGSTLNIKGLFHNLSTAGTLTGGTYTITGVLGLQNPVVTNAANVTLNGAAAEIFNSNTATNALSALAANAATGSLTLQNGQKLTTTSNFSNAGKVNVAITSGFTTHGSYTQTAGTTTLDGTLTANHGFNLQKGSVMGQGTLAAVVTSNATVTVGDSSTRPGKLTVTGTYTQSATGMLNVAVEGTTVGTQYSQMAVSNGISLSGTLNIKRINSFLPAIGETFTILTGSAVSGLFTTVNGLSINSGEHFEITYTATAVKLTVVSGP